MAYRTEVKKTVKEAIDNLVDFLTNPVSMEVDRSLATGDGNIEGIGFNYDNAQTETWELKYDASNNVFKVTGSVSGEQADAQIDEYYDNGIIHFTIRQGDQAWQDGDTVLIKAIKGSNPPFKVVGKGWYNTTANNKAWIIGTYGFTNSYNYITDKIKKSKDVFSIFTSIQSTYHIYNEGTGIGYIFSYGHYSSGNDVYIAHYYSSLYNNNINSSSHKIDGDVSIVLNVPLKSSQIQTYTQSWTVSYLTVNRCYIYNLTSTTYTSETTKFIEFSLKDNKIIFMEEEICDFTDYINQNEDKFLQSVVITIDSANGYLNVYIDGQKIVENLQNDKWKNVSALWGKSTQFPLLDGYYVYNRKLNDDEVLKIANNNGHPPSDLRDFWVSIVNDTGWLPYIILQSNKYGFLVIMGTEIYWYPTVSVEWSNQVSYATPSTNSNRFNRLDPNVYKNNPYSFYKPKFYWGNYNDLNDTIERYWYVTDGSSLAIAIKKYNPAILDHTTYQIMYIGWGEGDAAYDYPFVLGWGGNNAFDEDNDAFRFGYMYNDNTAFWNGTAWVNNYVDDGALNGEWQNIKMDNNQFSVIQVNKFKNLSNQQAIVNFGYPKWLYLINTTDIQPEVEVYINGDKYFVIPDNHKKAPYNYLLKMDKE